MEKYILAPYVRTGYINNEFSLGYGSIQYKIVDKNLIDTTINFLKTLKTPRTLQEINIVWKNSSINLSRKIQEEFFRKFIEGNYLIQDSEYDSYNRYSRNLLYYNLSGAVPSAVQEKLKNKKILILGCGGIGNCIAYHLVTSGVGNIILMDQDTIESSNLTRQFLFTEKNIGSEKTRLLRDSLIARNSETNITCIDQKISQPEDLENIPNDIDLIVLSADKPSTLVFWINDYAIRKRVPFINVGYVEDIAVWGPFVIPQKTGCFRCQSIVSKEKSLNNISLSDINSHYQAPSIGPINMIASSLASLDILRYLGEFGSIQSLNKRYGLWTHDLHFQTQNCEKNANCPTCSQVKNYSE